MTARARTATCRDCGEPFRASRSGVTVRCPDCRMPSARPDTDCPVCDRTEGGVVVYRGGRPSGTITTRSASGVVKTDTCHFCAGTGQRPRTYRVAAISRPVTIPERGEEPEG